jgi:hypothetical protein
MSTIDITVFDPEFAVALAAEGLSPKLSENAEDGPSLVFSIDNDQALVVVAALLRMVRDNPGLAPDVFDAIAHLMQWQRLGR